MILFLFCLLKNNLWCFAAPYSSNPAVNVLCVILYFGISLPPLFILSSSSTLMVRIKFIKGLLFHVLVSNRGELAKYICLFYRKSKIIELVLVIIKCVLFILHVA